MARCFAKLPCSEGAPLIVTTNMPVTSTKPPLVSVIIVNTNELHHLRDLLPTSINQTYPNYEIIVVDNGSTDGSLAFIAEQFVHHVKVVENGANLGYVGANNIGFEHARGDYIIVLNPDTALDPDWIQELVADMEAHPDAGMATSQILMFDDHDVINTCGNEVSLIGIGFCRGLGQPANSYTNADEVASVSGAAFIIRRDVLERIGGFDETYWAYVEDTDISWRAILAGYTIRYVPKSIVYHKYKLKMSPYKFFHIDRNRYLLLFKHLRILTLLLMLPLLVMSEIMLWGYALVHGRDYLQQRLRMYGWFAKNWTTFREARRKTQNLRKVPDRVILKVATHRIGFSEASNGLIGRLSNYILNPVFYLYHRFLIAVVRW